MATLLAARRGDGRRASRTRATPTTPSSSVYESGALLPGPGRHARRPDVRGSGSTRRPEGYAPSARSVSPKALQRAGDPRQRDAGRRRAAPPSAAPRRRRRAGSSPSGSAARPGRRRTPRPRARRRRGARAAARASCAPVLTPCARQRGAQRLEVGIEVEGARGRAAEGAGGGDLLVRRGRDEAVQAAAAGDVLADLVGLAEDVGGRVLHRSGEARPHLAGHPAQRARRVGAERPVGQPAEPDPPAAERHALAQPVGDEDALGQQRGGADAAPRARRRGRGRSRRRRSAGRARAATSHTASTSGAGATVPVGLSGRVRTRIAGSAAGRARRAERVAQGVGVGDAARLLGDRDVEHALAGQRRLRGVAHPRRARQDDVARQHGEQRVEQRLAAGRDEDAIGARSAARAARSTRRPPRAPPGSPRPARSRSRPPPRPGARRRWAGPAGRPRRRRGAARARPPRSGPARARWSRAWGTAAERRATTTGATLGRVSFLRSSAAPVPPVEVATSPASHASRSPGALRSQSGRISRVDVAQVAPEVVERRPPPEPVAVVDRVDDEPRLEHERVRDHRVVVGVGVLLDVEVLLDDAPRVGEERPLGADRVAELLERVVRVGRDRGDLGVGHGDLRIVRGELEVLLVLLRAVVAAREREDQRVVALDLAELAGDARRDRAARSRGTCRRERCRRAWVVLRCRVARNSQACELSGGSESS